VDRVAVFRVTPQNSGGDVIIRVVVNPETASDLILVVKSSFHSVVVVNAATLSQVRVVGLVVT
jgi:hypothetical protein